MNPGFDLRKEVEAYISRAIDSSMNYSGEEGQQNRWNWVQITTDRIVAAVMNSLPEPVDINHKYETDSKGILIQLSDGNKEHNDTQIEYLGKFAEDQGWNKYFFAYTDYLKGLYSLPDTMVQSQYDKDDNSEEVTIHRGDPNEEDSDQEPSKVR